MIILNNYLQKVLDMDWTCQESRKHDHKDSTTGWKKKRGCPKITWRRTGQVKLKEFGYTWGTTYTLARDRQNWKDFVAALRTSRPKGK